VSTVFGSRRVAPVAAVALGALTLGLGLATVPLDILTDAVGEGLRRGLLSALESGARGLGTGLPSWVCSLSLLGLRRVPV
jgi:hypothetical protein